MGNPVFNKKYTNVLVSEFYMVMNSHNLYTGCKNAQCKVKVVSVHAMKTYRGEQRYSSTNS